MKLRIIDMQYIQKGNTQPEQWDAWFTTASNRRSYNYLADSGSLTLLWNAREYLIREQNGLCAYCQCEISLENSSIEHVVPKEFNMGLSTNYYNLVAVCKTQLRDQFTDRLHCDKEKGSKPISPLIFFSSSEVNNHSNHSFFIACSDGFIKAKPRLTYEIEFQVESFIEVVNLNHSGLKEMRTMDVLNGIISASICIPRNSRRAFWISQFRRIESNKSHPFRQFLLIYIGGKLGIN